LNIHDDPFRRVKRVAEKDLETMLLEYFAGLQERIKESVPEVGERA
jgi:hypothetical protein